MRRLTLSSVQFLLEHQIFAWFVHSLVNTAFILVIFFIVQYKMLVDRVKEDRVINILPLICKRMLNYRNDCLNTSVFRRTKYSTRKTSSETFSAGGFS